MDFGRYLRRIPTLAELAIDACHSVINVPFSKFQESGNDFIMIDNQDRCFDELFDEVDLIQKMCERRFGIGAEGLIVLSKHRDVDFEVTCYTSDGKPSLACGAGTRCVVAFASYAGLYDDDKEAVFLTPRGVHHGSQLQSDPGLYRVHLPDVDAIETFNGEHYFVGTASPQHVKFVDVELPTREVVLTGKDIRNDANYRKLEAANVVFVHVLDDSSVSVRTYDWRKDDEVFSNTSAAVAAAIATEARRLSWQSSTYICSKQTSCRQNVRTLGGQIQVMFTLTTRRQVDNKTTARDIYLVGPANHVYHGVFKWKMKNY